MAENRSEFLDLLVDKDTDFDTTFEAVCYATGEKLSVNGWMWKISIIDENINEF